MKDSPIVVFCSPRGGSSLVAGIIRAHGVWVGRTYKGTEYENHENADIKAFLKDNWKLDPGKPMPDPQRADLPFFCKSILPENHAWMMKVAAEYYPIFEHWFPKMTPVMVFRNKEKAIEGLVKRKGPATRDLMTQHVNDRYDYMEQIIARNPMAVAVSSDDVVEGEYAQIEEILSRYDIKFNPELAASTIRPSIYSR